MQSPVEPMKALPSYHELTEALDEEGLKKFNKRVSLDKNMEALEVARKLGCMIAVNVIAGPEWDAKRFQVVRDWALKMPEIVHLSVRTPYPGTAIWQTEGRQVNTRDYRLFDVQHAVLPTKMPLLDFYKELVKTQDVLNKKHLGLKALWDVVGITFKNLLKGQTNFLKMLWKFNSVYNPAKQAAEHSKQVAYPMALPQDSGKNLDTAKPSDLFVHEAHLRS